MSFSDVNLQDFEFAVDIAAEVAKKKLGTDNPQVIATLAHTYVTLALMQTQTSDQKWLAEHVQDIANKVGG